MNSAITNGASAIINQCGNSSNGIAVSAFLPGCR
jgi:hypothetical protein